MYKRQLINRGKPAVSDNAISLKASNASERAAFLSQFGWDIEEDPVEVEMCIRDRLCHLPMEHCA